MLCRLGAHRSKATRLSHFVDVDVLERSLGKGSLECDSSLLILCESTILYTRLSDLQRACYAHPLCADSIDRARLNEGRSDKRVIITRFAIVDSIAKNAILYTWLSEARFLSTFGYQASKGLSSSTRGFPKFWEAPDKARMKRSLQHADLPSAQARRPSSFTT